MEFKKYKNEYFQPSMLWPNADWHKLKTLTVAETTTTPLAAAHILAHCNNRNRNLTDSRARYLGQVMSHGKWVMTGEPLIFDKEGESLSTQHRLQGCVYSGVEIPTVVMLDVDPMASDWVDNVRAKTVGDRFAAVGMSHAQTLAGMLRVMYCWRMTGQLGRIHRYQFDMDQAHETMDAFPGLAASAAWCPKNKDATKFFRGPAISGSLHWIMEQVGEGLGHEFLSMAACNRIPTEEKWNVVAKLSKQLGGWRSGATIEDVSKITLKAWNIFREGRQIQTLVVRPDEAYPKVYGWKYDGKGRPVSCGTFKLPPIVEEKEEL